MRTNYRRNKLIESRIDNVIQRNMQKYFPEEKSDCLTNEWNNHYKDFFIFTRMDSPTTLKFKKGRFDSSAI